MMVCYRILCGFSNLLAEINMFVGIFKNRFFIAIMVITFAVQVFIVDNTKQNLASCCQFLPGELSSAGSDLLLASRPVRVKGEWPFSMDRGICVD